MQTSRRGCNLADRSSYLRGFSPEVPLPHILSVIPRLSHPRIIRTKYKKLLTRALPKILGGRSSFPNDKAVYNTYRQVMGVRITRLWSGGIVGNRVYS